MAILVGSRYENTKLYKIDDKIHVGIRKLLELKNYDDNITHVVSQYERIEIIANKYWNRPDLFYIICDWNNIFNPMDELEIGKVLILPSLMTILEEKL
jgi:hypothetical protein